MNRKTVLTYLLSPNNWWLPLLLVIVVSLAGVSLIGVQTYRDAPPMPRFVTPSGKTVIERDDILAGQDVFHKYALMDYGSFFGDGALKGPDFTADALHEVTLTMQEYYRDSLRAAEGSLNDWQRDAMAERVRSELKKNRHDENTNTVGLTRAQAHAADVLVDHYQTFFTDGDGKKLHLPEEATQQAAMEDLSAFFFWGAWVSSVERPGASYSYTHNWPYDPEAGNTATGPVILWSILGLLGLVLGLGGVLYYYGQMEELDDETFLDRNASLMTDTRIDAFRPTRTQRATYKFFAAAIVLFLIQVLSGALAINEFVGYLSVFGIDVSSLVPITVSRSWHLQLSLFWISACWVGASIFVLPLISNEEPDGQLTLINTVFGLFAVMAAGSIFGIAAGPQGLLGDLWYWLGHQGWEFMEFGRLYQVMLLGIFVLWAVIIYRGVRPALRDGLPWRLPNWLIYATVSILILLLSGFVASRDTNFVIADFWRWAVIHMWVEAFFEVFTTIIIGYLMVLMGLVSRRSTERVIFLATLLFLGSGLLGISHNFYWNAKPVATMALGSVFSTLQVVPLILLTLEAWRFRRMPSLAMENVAESNNAQFGMTVVFWFLLAVNFWNFFGAGVFGLIINLPIVNYFEHGTYLTVNHGHAALMGVYGNLSIAALLFCCRLLFNARQWSVRLLRGSFWALNVGLLLMVVIDLFPAGVLQFSAVVDHGLWFARSGEFISGTPFMTLTWLRGIGGTLFLLGGVVPLVWLVLSRWRSIKAPASVPFVPENTDAAACPATAIPATPPESVHDCSTDCDNCDC